VPLAVPGLLSRVAIDLTALRESRDLRLMIGGKLVSGLGTQATLVALPFQIYVLTKSALLVGLLGIVELLPVVLFSLVGGVWADRYDRRKLLLIDQIGLVACAGGLALVTLLGSPPLAALYVLGALLAGFGSIQQIAGSAIVPNLVKPEHLRQALAVNYGLMALTLTIGPAIGGGLIALFGVGAAYTIDAASCAAVIVAVLAMSPQPPIGRAHDAAPERVLSSIGDGLRFVRGNNALLGSFAIDLLAMTFGMPRALFAVLSVSVYHAGAAGTGVLYAAVAAGSAVAALTTGWLGSSRRLGRIVIWAVLAWGASIALAGFAGSLWLAALLLAAAGAADSVSAVCRMTINQTVTPDRMRGRMSSVFQLVVTSGPRLGDLESGAVAGLVGVRFSVVSGGLACVAGVGLIVLAFPTLLAYDAQVAEAEAVAAEAVIVGG
jgi:MFS family permease